MTFGLDMMDAISTDLKNDRYVSSRHYVNATTNGKDTSEIFDLGKF